MSKSRLKLKDPLRSLLILSVAIAMLVWNWQLLLATSVGLLLMLLLYWLQEWNWQTRLANLRRLVSGSNRQLTLAVGGGGIATLGSYMAISVWLDTESPWIAAGGILQGLGTLVILLLLMGRWASQPVPDEGTNLERLLLELTAAEPLRRFIAVKRLTRSLRDQECDREEYRTVIEAWRLMLSVESEPAVRNALLDGLKMLKPKAQKPRPVRTQVKPLSLPLDLQPAVKAQEL